MKTKTIKKVISNKLNNWLESITDVKLRKEVKENLLVSGGAIASMLLGDPVNDYDIYIQDMDVLKRLAKYYGGSVNILDGRKREEYLDAEFADVMEAGGMVWVDGKEVKCESERFIRLDNLKPDQIKMDIDGAGIRFDLLSHEDESKHYDPVFFSQNAISLSNDIQIVLRFNGTVEEIHKTFDFIHATNYFTFAEGLVLNQAALESLLTKNLMYQGSLYPLTSIIRMKKFLLRGWGMSAGEILKIMFQISEFDLTDVNVLEDQLIGVDVAYFSTLINILRGADKESLTSSYINSIIDKVFNEHTDDRDNIKPE